MTETLPGKLIVNEIGDQIVDETGLTVIAEPQVAIPVAQLHLRGKEDNRKSLHGKATAQPAGAVAGRTYRSRIEGKL